MKLLSLSEVSIILFVSLILCFDSVSEVKANLFSANWNKLQSSDNLGNYQATEVIEKNPIDLIRIRGFKAELHYARTKDGYHIHLARIINPMIRPSIKLKRPVIFNHGLMETSTIWLINARDVKPLPYVGECGILPNELDGNGTIYRNGAFLLANKGYDVWLMSMRGTEYSLQHDHLTPLDDEFWDYSLDDFALKDVPTVVDYVRTYTKSSKVGYIGHSQATFSVFGLLSTYPSYSDIIEPVIAVAPVAYFHHITSLSRPIFLAALAPPQRLQQGPFPPEARKVRTAITRVCASNITETPPMICSMVEGLVAGRGERWLKGFYNHLPYMSSWKVMRHFGILIKNKMFQRYEYGKSKNQRIYGSKNAPAYSIERIDSKYLCLISTKSDALSPPEDVKLFKKRLTVPLYKDIFIDKNFDHFDLTLDDSAAHLVNKPILEILETIEVESGNCGTSHLESSPIPNEM